MMIRFQTIPFLPIVLGFLFAMSITGRLWADHDEAKSLSEAGTVVPVAQLIEYTIARYPGHLFEVELEKVGNRHFYEIEWLEDNGHVRELWFDARTGTPVNNIHDEDHQSVHVP